MWKLVQAKLERRIGFDPGPRVRPRIDRYVADESELVRMRAAGHIPLLDVGSTVVGPNILITMDRGDGPGGPEARIGVDYVRAVLRAGGRPLLLPPGEARIDDLLSGADGLVITGGAFDIHPSHYGQTVSARLDRVEATRTDMELALARAALAAGLPVLGICGGMQVLAVAAGGSLVQDLPEHPTHEQPTDPALPWHAVRLVGQLASILGESTGANSTHHQAVDDPGRGFFASGWSPDGVIEAIEHREHFAIGVQWHPERLGDLRLYAALVNAAEDA